MKVLITCGPTWVPIDDVRVISNTSTGQMGHTIAQKFKKAGVQVTLIEGAVTHALQAKGIKVIKYRFFDELAAVLKREVRRKYDIVIHAAAVSDFKVTGASKTKIASAKAITLRLAPTEKLINAIKKLSPESFLVGFKLESQLSPKGLLNETKSLFIDSGCDVVVANTIKNGYHGFIVDADGNILVKANNKQTVASALVKIIL